MSEIKKPSSEEIILQLRRILQCPDFSRSVRQSDFLEYVVHKTLAGEEEQIKGYTVGIDVFDKPKDFNPETDSSVRVEATRLRTALKLYYHGPGKDDPIIIRIPKGSYVPTFHYSVSAAIISPHLTTLWPRLRGRLPAPFQKPSAIAIAAVFFVFLVLGAYSITTVNFMGNPRTRAGDAALPVIAVLPFYTIGNKETQTLGIEMADALVEKLTLFSSLRALNTDNVADYEYPEGKNAEIGKKLKANYLIEGTIQQSANTADIRIRLLDLQQSTYVWTYNRQYEIDMSRLQDFEDDLMGHVAAQLASPYGIIEGQEQMRLANMPGEAAKHYRCLLDYYAYSNRKSPEKHAQVRTCLENTVEEDPQNTEAWASLSWVYGDEKRFGYNMRGSEESAKKRSFEAAQTAIKTNPKSSRAHQFMALAAQLNGNAALTRQHAKLALSLNPYDSESVADAAWSFCQLAEWDQCKSLGEKALDLNPHHPDWYNLALFTYYYQFGDYDKALYHALEYYQPDFLWANIILAAAYAGVNKHDEAADIARLIVAKSPEFLANPYEPNESWNMSDDFYEKLLIGVEAAGVELSPAR